MRGCNDPFLSRGGTEGAADDDAAVVGEAATRWPPSTSKRLRRDMTSRAGTMASSRRDL